MRINIKQIKKIIIKMDHYKISKLLDDSSVSKFVTGKWTEVNDLSCGQYSANKKLRFMPTSDLYDYSDAFIIVKETIDLEVAENNMTQKGI